MRSRRSLLLFISAVLVLNVSGCSSLHPGSVDRTIEGSYEQVFRATFEMLRARQFPIQRVDLEGGRIVTGHRPIQIVRETRPVEKVDARIEREEGGIDVRLLLVFVDQMSNSERPVRDDGDDERTDDVLAAAFSQSFGASIMYDEYLDAIQERAEGLRGRDTP